MVCDMCSSEGKLYKAIVEDAELTVCDNCSKFGKVISVIKQTSGKITPKADQNIESKPETMDILINDYAEIIRKKRESLDLKQKDFAKKINEKESLIQKIESGHFEPSIELAKKIENFLKIKLIEEYEETHETQAKTKTDSFTIGDYIKIMKNRPK